MSSQIAGMRTFESAVAGRLHRFEEERASLPRLRESVERLRRDIRAVDRNADPTAFFTAQEALREAERTLQRIESGQDEIDFLLSAAPFIREYHEQPVITPCDGATPCGAGGTAGGSGSAGGGLDSVVEIQGSSNRLEIYRRYLAEVERDPTVVAITKTRTKESFECETCEEALLFVACESRMVCPKCGVTFAHMQGDETNLSYDQQCELNPASTFAYKRINHFVEWLTSLQARENTEIPKEVLDAVREEFKKARVTVRGDIRPQRVREYLKKLKLNKWYEHCHAICALLNGVPPPHLSPALEHTLRQMFIAIQAPFEKHCPPTRKNFLSYSYTLHKFCELLGEDQLLRYFPLLKSSEKLYIQDSIWKKICEELGWQFIKSSNLRSL